MMLIHALALSLATLSPPALAGEYVVLAPLRGVETVFGGDDCGQRTLPASTFNVPHARIVLQTHVVTGETVIAWDGKKRDYPAWNRDQTLESAIKTSAVWVFQQFAASIGRERELEHMRAFRYGSASQGNQLLPGRGGERLVAVPSGRAGDREADARGSGGGRAGTRSRPSRATARHAHREPAGRRAASRKGFAADAGPNG